ncbi:MAG TPA: YggT family protein [Candidatus Limnocylindria bacterium]|nr:YggT family protein [Candidatus Limnocylindria bacterium]
MCAVCLLILFAEAFINVLGGLLVVGIFVRVVLSWVPTLRLPFDLGDFVFGVTEPVLSPIRRLLPAMGGFDLSPLIAIIAIQFAQSILLRLLPPPIPF